jgi:hypothetical protein
MKIKYIIDYKGFGSFYQQTNTRNGECLDITKEQAKGYLGASDVWFSGKAEVSVKSVDQVEVKRPLGYSVPHEEVRNDSLTRRLEGVLQPHRYSNPS